MWVTWKDRVEVLLLEEVVETLGVVVNMHEFVSKMEVLASGAGTSREHNFGLDVKFQPNPTTKSKVMLSGSPCTSFHEYNVSLWAFKC